MMHQLPKFNSCSIAIIGLGYVGLPLAVEFARSNLKNKNNCFTVYGYDIDSRRINELNNGYDRTNEIKSSNLKNLKNLIITDNSEKLIECDVFIVTVPTPITEAKMPDLNPLINASRLIGAVLKNKNLSSCNPVIIYESTVYPGATEEVCIPEIEKCSALVRNVDFGFGYSPERVNPGDPQNPLTSIVKVTSGSTDQVSYFVDNLYSAIITAGTYSAKSIKIAEAAKVIENTQRDLNVALVNELSMIFKKMNLDTLDVLEAASTKWNFMRFTPGLVGGHCIGVDPYYLLYKSESLGYSPQVVLAGRRINDNYGHWIVEQLIDQLIIAKINPVESNILVLGYTFKENCPDTRNTRVNDILSSLCNLGIQTTLFDPYVQPKAEINGSIHILEELSSKTRYDAVIVAVSHDSFKKMSLSDWESLLSENSLIIDIKGIVPRELNPWRI